MYKTRKCQQNEAAYPAFQLDSSIKLDQLTAHWTWTGLSRAFSKLRVDLKGLKILTPSLQHRLQNLLYATGPNLTEHRIMVNSITLVEKNNLTRLGPIDPIDRTLLEVNRLEKIGTGGLEKIEHFYLSQTINLHPQNSIFFYLRTYPE